MESYDGSLFRFGEWVCEPVCVCVCVCVHACVCVSVSMPVHADGDQGFRIGPTVRAYMCADEHLRGSSKHMY